MRYFSVPVHVVFILLVGLIGSWLQVFHFDFSTIQFAPYDPSWYRSIAFQGYSYQENVQGNTAFFPLFPFVWGLLNVDEYGISIFNFLLYVASVVLLIREYKLSFAEGLIASSSLGMFYCWLPFSEAVFLTASTSVLIGYKRNSLFLISIGLLLCGLTRSATVVFVPCIFLVAAYQWFICKEDVISVVSRSAVLLLASILSVLIVVLIQWHYTGEWFVFGKMQLTWNKKFQFPQIPLKTWDNFKTLFIDTSALIVGLLSFVWLAMLFFCKVKDVKEQQNADLIFALSYTTLVVTVSLMFGVQGENTTFINSLNRYVFGTAFFLVLSIHHLRKKCVSISGLLVVSTAVLIGIGLTGYFSNPYDVNQLDSARLDAIGIFAAFVLCYLVSYERTQPILSMIAYVFQLILQLHFFELYLKKSWVG